MLDALAANTGWYQAGKIRIISHTLSSTGASATAMAAGSSSIPLNVSSTHGGNATAAMHQGSRVLRYNQDMHNRAVPLLEAAGIEYVPGQNSVMISCPLPGHEDNSPSLSIRNNGSWRCFGACNRGGTWDELREFLDVGVIPSKMDADNPWALLSDKPLSDSVVTRPRGLFPRRGPYRGLTEDFLRELGAMQWLDNYDREDPCERIWFPVFVLEKLAGWVARRLDKSRKRTYRNSREMRAKEVLFPYDVVRAMRPRYIVLVEGPMDALRLIAAGIPALAILGVGTWSETKRNLIKALPAKFVLVCLDNEEDEKKKRKIDALAESIASDLARVVDTFLDDHLPVGCDPGNAPDDVIVAMRTWCEDLVETEYPLSAVEKRRRERRNRRLATKAR